MRKYYKVGDDIVFEANDLDIEEIEEWFGVKVKDKKLFRSIDNGLYRFKWINEKGEEYEIIFNNDDLNFSQINREIKVEIFTTERTLFSNKTFTKNDIKNEKEFDKFIEQVKKELFNYDKQRPGKFNWKNY